MEVAPESATVRRAAALPSGLAASSQSTENLPLTSLM
jgi:hypothetical protein